MVQVAVPIAVAVVRGALICRVDRRLSPLMCRFGCLFTLKCSAVRCGAASVSYISEICLWLHPFNWHQPPCKVVHLPAWMGASAVCAVFRWECGACLRRSANTACCHLYAVPGKAQSCAPFDQTRFVRRPTAITRRPACNTPAVRVQGTSASGVRRSPFQPMNESSKSKALDGSRKKNVTPRSAPKHIYPCNRTWPRCLVRPTDLHLLPRGICVFVLVPSWTCTPSSCIHDVCGLSCIT